MNNRKRGNQSSGGVYRIDKERVIKDYKESKTAYTKGTSEPGLNSFFQRCSADDLKDAGVGGKDFGDSTFVYANLPCWENRPLFEIGERLPGVGEDENGVG
ncbi:hypothetical protein THAOC_13974 [Thalassiosira oceanica]|uniref:Uncharacterized protein n=1 Tax=Thalassiosira oceanica TaxID=159749 RepID=K0T4F2_THAOC|nr:hypothetical protein THAOC_13974 [Thalassiosira oceanica]|eukprot:EJK65197.1 hypothetical protein THAOC_13974 [Thalassiosira oceanica]